MPCIWKKKSCYLEVNAVLQEANVTTQPRHLCGQLPKRPKRRHHGKVPRVLVQGVPNARLERVAGLLADGEGSLGAEAVEVAPRALPRDRLLDVGQRVEVDSDGHAAGDEAVAGEEGLHA